jgi:hypothetical protein
MSGLGKLAMIGAVGQGGEGRGAPAIVAGDRERMWRRGRARVCQSFGKLGTSSCKP